MEILEDFAQRIKLLRSESELTQKAMAKLLGCPHSHYQKIEYGKVNISVTMLAFLADYFQVSTDFLLGRTDNRDVNL